MSLLRNRLRPWIGGLAFAALAIVGGCQSRGDARQAANAKPIGLLNRPTIDLSHGGAGFPLQGPANATGAPADVETLAARMKAAYARRLTDGGDVTVEAKGLSPGRLESLTIDLTGSSVKPEVIDKSAPPPESADKHEKAAKKPDHKPVAVTHVGRLSYIADPLKYQTFSAGMRLEIESAELATFAGGDGQFVMALVDSGPGAARLRISQDDLREGMLAAAKAKLKNDLTFSIDAIDLRLQSERPSTLAGEVTLHARFLFVPATIQLHGRVDVAGNNILFTELEANGRDPGGAIVAAFVQDKLDTYNRKIARILKTPGDKVHITTLTFRLDQNLTIDARFAGSKGADASHSR